jgi:hypothetical protein
MKLEKVGTKGTKLTEWFQGAEQELGGLLC